MFLNGLDLISVIISQIFWLGSVRQIESLFPIIGLKNDPIGGGESVMDTKVWIRKA